MPINVEDISKLNTKAEIVELLSYVGDTDFSSAVRNAAVCFQKQHFGNKVYVRGLIEFTNYCRNGCYYCGINASCKETRRYRLTKEEILECCKMGYSFGLRTFVLQGGEDSYYTDDILVDIIQSIKALCPEAAVTLSIGERSYESYKTLKKAGADRYLLRHETADDTHYRLLHPENMSLHNRKKCLYNLKELGYQVGAGFMVGSPGQSIENLAEDILFLKALEPEMIGIGPFIPHHETIFAGNKPGDVKLTLYLLSILRIIFPKVLLPATTALGTIDSMGREKGIMAGANVVMPNLSPPSIRKDYDLYDNKICTGEEAVECLGCLDMRMKKIGYELSFDRGDYAK